MEEESDEEDVQIVVSDVDFIQCDDVRMTDRVQDLKFPEIVRQLSLA